MLTDTKLRNLKPTGKLYKVPDRDGLYVAVTEAGSISFRYNYTISGRQETLTFGRYGVMTLAEAREQLAEAKKMIAAGKSPAKEKARVKARVKDAENFGAWAEKWLRGYEMAESTRDMRRSVYERELKPKFENQKLQEITHKDLRILTDAIVARGAPATAVHAREVVLQVFRWAKERGQKVENPADLVRPSAIATFHARDRALSSDEIGLMYEYLEKVGTGPQFKVAAKLLLLTMVRRGELVGDQFHRGAVDDSKRTDEAAQPAPGVLVAPGSGYFRRPENLCGRFGICAAWALRWREADERRNLEPGAGTGVRGRAKGR